MIFDYEYIISLSKKTLHKKEIKKPRKRGFLMFIQLLVQRGVIDQCTGGIHVFRNLCSYFIIGYP